MRYLVIFFCVMISSGVIAQRSDKKDSPVMSGSFVYSLPRTGIRVHVKATEEKFFHGPYFSYAKALLGINNVSSEDKVKWTIDDINIETFSEPDPVQIHLAKGDFGVLISMTPSGIISGINSQSEIDKNFSPVTSFYGEQKTPEIPYTDLSLKSFIVKEDSLNYDDKIIIKSMQEKVKDAAKTIIKLRNRRFKLLTGDEEKKLPDGESYGVMVDQLKKLEKEYVALFVGKSFFKTFEYTFDYIPGNNTVSGNVIFRFSESGGVLPSNDMSGKPVTIDVKKDDNLFSAQSNGTSGLSGGVNTIYYRLPGKAEVKLSLGIRLLATSSIEVAQFGTVAPVPEGLLNGDYSILFYPETGEIKQVSKIKK
ncbi:MAG: DUF4831 family protein [Prolixibacteraceae bacterium]|nr:DUF4831 family protein [Prolixibacteraceae bacterium]